MTAKDTTTLQTAINNDLADNTTQQVSETEIRESIIDVTDSMINKVDNPIADIKSGRKNLIINGDFRIWERGTSGTTSGDFVADRWASTFTNGGSASQQAFTPGQTDVPGEPEFFHRLVASTSSGQNILATKTENVRNGAGQTVTLSFWAKAVSAFTFTQVKLIQNFGSGGSGSVTSVFSVVNITTSWQKFERSIALPSISGKTIGAGNFLALQFRRDDFAFTLDVARVQLEIGSEATDFEYRPIAEELALCQRYYWRGKISHDPGYFYSVASDTSMVASIGVFPVTMRDTPTLSTITSPSLTNCSGFTLANPTVDGFVGRVTVTSSARYRASGGIYDAEAEL